MVSSLSETLVVALPLQPSGSTGTTEHKGDDVAKEDRGFASMDRARQREIASKGGKAAHQKGTAHEWTSEEARDAGRKGGLASHRRRREQKDSESSESSDLVGARAGGAMDMDDETE
jgi:general stress protein YciG